MRTVRGDIEMQATEHRRYFTSRFFSYADRTALPEAWYYFGELADRFTVLLPADPEDLLE